MSLKDIYLGLPDDVRDKVNRAYHKTNALYLALYHLVSYGTADMFHDINIETTTYCNRRCNYCPNSRFDRGLRSNEKKIPEETYLKIINELSDIKYRGRLSPHFFGEPLADKRIPELMKVTRELLPRARIVIYTNGDLLDLELLKKLYRVGVRRYLITLHGEKPEREKNRRRIVSLLAQVKKEGLKLHVQLKVLGSGLSNRGGLLDIHRSNKNVRCSYSTNPVVINVHGDVVLCCDDYLGTIKFGNIEKEDLMAIWNKARYKKLRKDLRNRIYHLEICKQCLA